MKPLFGIETEFAVAATAALGGRFPQERLMAVLIDAARRVLPHLTAPEGGLFLRNGAKLYVDSGCHPEYATPECTEPLEAVRQVLAGERILLQVAAHMEKTDPTIERVRVFKTNVDYSGARSTWGCHESYLHTAPPGRLPAQLIPHLVTRIIYTGAGGFDPFNSGVRFMLSPRAAHIEEVCSAQSTSSRGIYHTKNESLSRRGYSRLHLLCGESVSSHAAMYLKVGTTALVLALADAGMKPGKGVALEEPLDALRAVATDEAGAALLKVDGGRRVSAIDIQFHYLEAVEAYIEEQRRPLPDWAPQLCRVWRATLEDLRTDFRSLAGSLDWAIKRAVYDDRLEAYRRKPTTRARAELFEADARFGQLGAEGIFDGLDAADALDHRIVDSRAVDEATKRPPQEGRARLRGEVVSRLADGRDGSHCRWQHVFDGNEQRLLDLTDPFESVERWKGNGGAEPAFSLGAWLDSL